MTDNELKSQVKVLAKKFNTTQSSLIRGLVEYALDHADLGELEFQPAKKVGRKPKVAVDAIPDNDETITENVL